MTNSDRILQMHTHKHNACKGRVKDAFTCVLCFTKSISFKSKLYIFFIVNQDVVLVSLRKVILRTLCFSAAGANDLIERPVAFGRKLSILQPNECKILQLLNMIQGGFFNCSARFSVPKRKTNCSQPGLVFHEIFNVNKTKMG